MGRKKLEIKRIESKSSRQVTFTKRRNGLIKKAKELSILCDVDLGLLIYSARGKLFSFSSSNNSLGEIVERYHSCVEAEANESAAICEAEQDRSKLGTFLTVKDLLDGVERHLEDSTELSRTDFISLEDQLEAALQETRARKFKHANAISISLAEIVERYHSFVEAEANETASICEAEQDGSKLGTFLTMKDLLHGVERHLEDSTELSRTDFISMEDQLEAALQETRARKTQLMMATVTSLEEKEKMLIEENKLLTEKIAMDGEQIDKENAEFDCLANRTLQTLNLF